MVYNSRTIAATGALRATHPDTHRYHHHLLLRAVRRGFKRVTLSVANAFAPERKWQRLEL